MDPILRGRGLQPPRGQRTQRGFTLIEVAVAITVLLMGVAAISQSLTSTMRSGTQSRETDRAMQAARAMLERIQAEAFAHSFRSFNGNANDDPSGAGTAPGNTFAVEGLRAMPNDADGRPGEILFPTPTLTSNELRENTVDANWGMPRDLNGDGVVDAANHATDYKLLPVRVRVHWQSSNGRECQIQIDTLLANY